MKSHCILALALALLTACNSHAPIEAIQENQASIAKTSEITLPLSVFEDTDKQLFGYKDTKGTIVIPAQYPMAFTSDFRRFAFIADTDGKLYAINTKGNKLYEVFNYDNGPDYPSEGLFRIVKDGKIGYADAQTGEIIIEPKYKIALPFENEYATVSDTDAEKDAYLINKKGIAF